MQNKNPKIWVLVDNKTGNSNQAIELAQKVSENFEIKNIEYNHFGKLPNAILSLFPIHVKKSILKSLKNDNSPDLIISSGRRTASLAVYLKKISKNNTKTVQIMRPSLDPKEFDLIVLPQHDSFNYTLPNIVRIIGALTNVKEKAYEMQGEFEANYPNVKDFIAVIIGGSNKSYKLTLENAKHLSRMLSVVSENHSLPLFITFSRRTPNNVKKYFQEKFSWSSTIYDPESDDPNPYPAMMQNASYIITTTDSISMCSEAASTGKPLYVFSPADFKLKKHHFFIQQLVDLGIANRLEITTTYLNKYNYDPLCEIDKVADIIKEKLI